MGNVNGDLLCRLPDGSIIANSDNHLGFIEMPPEYDKAPPTESTKFSTNCMFYKITDKDFYAEKSDIPCICDMVIDKSVLTLRVYVDMQNVNIDNLKKYKSANLKNVTNETKMIGMIYPTYSMFGVSASKTGHSKLLSEFSFAPISKDILKEKSSDDDTIILLMISALALVIVAIGIYIVIRKK